MAEPLIVPRSEHTLSRRDIDPDALKVLYRLKQHRYVAYLVGGSVRDLLLGRHPKDYDVGTSAHPYEVKRLFRNCWIIGRRFRLAHVRFAPNKIIEVATFRRKAEAAEMPMPEATAQVSTEQRLLHRDNTFGTPEEDAFRRDFTINALFYDIDTFSIIDYVGGMEDLRSRVLRSIGDPNERFVEDPVRMLRAIVLAERLDVSIDPASLEAIERHGAEITKASPARMLEEYYKILRSGASERIFRRLARSGLLTHISPELVSPPDAVWRSLEALDEYRTRFRAAPDTLTNPVLIGSLLVPLGMMARRSRRRSSEHADVDADETPPAGGRPPKPPRLVLGMLPIARGDVEHLRHILTLQARLVDLPSSQRAQRSIMHRNTFAEAMTFMDIHGQFPETLQQWRGLRTAAGDEIVPEERPRRRRRRRRRGRRPPPHAAP
ncbi:MAG TPA: polynucleotide adenylyltransferase PcnB [Vicinamibacterales bacterium]|nr:polynucleotide adenylyltransferase PcnB [Vicinamibacterales bacterium]